MRRSAVLIGVAAGAVLLALIAIITVIANGPEGTGGAESTVASEEAASHSARMSPIGTPPSDAPTPSVPECSHVGDTAATGDEVLVYFTCEQPPADSRPVARHYSGNDAVESRLRFALEQLLIGPTAVEKTSGFSSPFGGASADLLFDVDVTDEGLAVIDFSEKLLTVNPNLNTSTVRFMVFRSLESTAFQFDEVAAIELRIEGSCERFARYFETTCEPWTRGLVGLSRG